jgi:hypothetical protein
VYDWRELYLAGQRRGVTIELTDAIQIGGRALWPVGWHRFKPKRRFVKVVSKAEALGGEADSGSGELRNIEHHEIEAMS